MKNFGSFHRPFFDYGGGFKTVQFVRHAFDAFAGTNQATVIFSSVALAGEFIVLYIAGTQTRSFTSLTGGGWTVIDAGPPTGVMMWAYKIAGAGEPASYTCTMGGTLTPGMLFGAIYRNVENVSPYLAPVDTVFSGVAATSRSLGATGITIPGLLVSGCNCEVVATTQWRTIPANGWTDVVVSSHQKFAYKVRPSSPPVTDTVTWSGGLKTFQHISILKFKAQNF